MGVPSELEARAETAGFALELFDRLPDVVFFLKDTSGRYVAVNETLVHRLGLNGKADLLGRTTRDLFPAPLGERYLAQDLGVCRSGREISDLLELHLYPNHREGWCVTTKVPVRGRDGAVFWVAEALRGVRVCYPHYTPPGVWRHDPGHDLPRHLGRVPRPDRAP